MYVIKREKNSCITLENSNSTFAKWCKIDKKEMLCHGKASAYNEQTMYIYRDNEARCQRWRRIVLFPPSRSALNIP